MTTLATRAFVGLVLGSTLLAGCSGNDSGGGTGDGADGGGQDRSSTASPGSPAAKDGEVGSEDCSLDRAQLSFVVRDWGRLFGSIGRGDHSTYTRAFVTTLTRTQADAEGCKGAADLTAFLAAARRIDARSRRATPDYDLYDAASTSGNAWLAKAGYGNNALTVG